MSGYQYNGEDLLNIFSQYNPPPNSANDSNIVVSPTSSSNLFNYSSNNVNTELRGGNDTSGANDYMRATVMTAILGSGTYKEIPYYNGNAANGGSTIDQNLMLSYKIHTANNTDVKINAPGKEDMAGVNGIHCLLIGGGGGHGGLGGNCKMIYGIGNNSATGYGGIGGAGGQGTRIVCNIQDNTGNTADFDNLSITVGVTGFDGADGDNKSSTQNAGKHQSSGNAGSTGSNGTSTVLFCNYTKNKQKVEPVSSAAGGNGGGGGGGASAYFHSDLKVNSNQGSPGSQGTTQNNSPGNHTTDNFNNDSYNWTGNTGSWSTDNFNNQQAGGGSYYLSNSDHTQGVTDQITAYPGAAIVVFLYN